MSDRALKPSRYSRRLLAATGISICLIEAAGGEIVLALSLTHTPSLLLLLLLALPPQPGENAQWPPRLPAPASLVSCDQALLVEADVMPLMPQRSALTT